MKCDGKAINNVAHISFYLPGLNTKPEAAEHVYNPNRSAASNDGYQWKTGSF